MTEIARAVPLQITVADTLPAKTPSTTETVLNEAAIESTDETTSYLSETAARRVGHILTSASTALITGGVYEFAHSQAQAGSLLFMAGTCTALFAHALYEDVADKLRTDEEPDLYTFRMPADMPHKSPQ